MAASFNRRCKSPASRPVLVRLDADLAGLRGRGLRDRHFEYAVHMARLDLIVLNVVRQREAAQEGAFDALEALKTFLVLRTLELPLAAQGQHAVFRRDA